MTFEILNNNVMLVELSGDEMEELHITYDSLNNDNEKTHFVLKSLLDKFDSQKRISKGEKVIVEAMPIENGGCFFIFTFVHNKKIRYKVKRNDMSLIFHSDNLDDFLDFISVLKTHMRNEQVCEAYKSKTNYYLVIPRENKIINRLIYEYGDKSRSISREWLIEHCENLGRVYLQ